MKYGKVIRPAAILLPGLLLMASCGEQNQTAEDAARKPDGLAEPRPAAAREQARNDALPRRKTDPIPSAAVKFQTFKLNAAEGGEFAAASGAVLRIPPDAFEDANGAPVSGEVRFGFREFRDAAEILASGLPMAYDSAGTTHLFQSAGMFETRARQQGRELRLRAGKAVELAYPPTRRGDGFNFYVLDKDGQNWRFERSASGQLRDARYVPLGFLSPSSNYKLSISFRPGAFQPGSSRRVVEARVVAAQDGAGNAGAMPIERKGKYLADTLTGEIDTLQDVGWPQFLKTLDCEEDKSAFDNARWLHNYSGRPKSLREIDKNVAAGGNFFTDCFAYALNELKIAKDAAEGAVTSVSCDVERPRAPCFLFLEAAKENAGANPLESVRAATAGEQWLNPAEDDVLRKKIAARFAGEKAAARLAEQLRNAAADSTALPTLDAAKAYAERRLRRLENLEVRLQAVGSGPVADFDNALYTAYASPKLRAVRLELRSLGSHNLDRYYNTPNPPLQAVAECLVQVPDAAAAPAYATLFCYNPDANVVQTFPAVGNGEADGRLRSYPMSIAPNWPVVGLALEDGRIALLPRKERARLAWRAVNRNPAAPVQLRFKFDGRRAGSLEALRAALK